MLTTKKIQNNIKGLSYWAKNYTNANDFFDFEIGDELSVAISDVFPNLRNEEFEIEDQKSYSTGPILVCVDTDGLLVIIDGHHRFNEAIKANHSRIDVIIHSVNVKPVFTGSYLYKSLSSEQKQMLLHV